MHIFERGEQMEITQLHYFKTVAKYESFTKAAAELHITQSALSRSIAQLEDDIGILLFERRKGGKITLNRDGKFFLTHVVQILNTFENTVSAVKEMAGLEKGVVNIAVTEEIYIKHIIHDFMLDYPDVRLNCRLQSDQQIQASLDDGTLNFAVSEHPIYGPDIEWIPLYQDRLTVVLPDGHPLQSRKWIHTSELSGERFIISNLGYGMDSAVIHMCQMAGFTPRVVYEGTGEDLCGQLVHDGIGVMITPHSINQGVRDTAGIEGPRIVAVPLADSFACNEIGIVRKTGQFQSAAATELFERILSYFESLSPLEISGESNSQNS